MVASNFTRIQRAIDRQPTLSFMLRTVVTDVTPATDHPAFGRIYNPL